ncbi:MAG: MBL fold metallo-hydrolase [Desulfobulbaceae bacterium]|jgi:glyoxylase-like metal-dependent hydrolase (beta-lactamase superfamily II)/rhodanese-related sulfurtransferase|nr:MBL fold metallo-hydrolase [Desulfobulbaceae bacterium]MDY0351619.1 MBL fold metallo-hydrolase [Desulfobulbaceae bacterium]
MNSVFPYTARDLYDWLTAGEDVVVVDVRNEKEFARFKVEGPRPFPLLNIPYFDFMEMERESVARLPRGKRLRFICATEASAKYVAEIAGKHGFNDAGYLTGGISSWGNLLVPRRVAAAAGYELYQFIRPGKASCSYGLVAGEEMMLFDPSRNVEFYLDFADRKNARIVKSFETHLQADYIAGSRMIAERAGAEFLANEADFQGAKIAYTPLRDGRRYGFSAGGPAIRALFTPGHTPGSTSYCIDDTFMLSGDTVFIRSIGRPDLGGRAEEWSKLLFATMQAVRRMDPNLVVLPGHFIAWDEADSELVFRCPLGEAIRRNESIYAMDTVDRFIDFIKANIRPQPEEYARIRRINANLEQADEEEQEILDIGKNECAASAYARLQTA